MKSQIIFNI